MPSQRKGNKFTYLVFTNYTDDISMTGTQPKTESPESQSLRPNQFKSTAFG